MGTLISGSVTLLLYLFGAAILVQIMFWLGLALFDLMISWLPSEEP